ncbi:MAG: hypothetical protein IJ757_05035 [Clostridiales bacterium]|nr:hypothetical protein [Clostridiales bacterium]
MHDYRQLALMLRPMEEKDMILYDMSTEDKAYAVKQFNRALLNSQRDGTDVAQIILKPLITKYPTWGDTALVYGLCLAREGSFRRAVDALEYAVNNSLASEQHLTVAQEAIKMARADEQEPAPAPEVRKRKKDISSMVGEGSSKPAARTAMQAPILMRASSGRNDFKMASEKEKRDIMMRSSSGGDEMNDDINVESVRTPADNLRLTVKIVSATLAVALVALLVIFVIIPTVATVRNSKDTSDRLDFLIDQLDQHKADPEVASIIEAYANNYGAGNASQETSTDQTTAESEVAQ